MSSAGTGQPLVTGATGFAGSHLVDRLLESHPRVHAWSHRTSHGATRDRIDWQQVDLLDRAAVFAAVRAARPSIVYHCAGLPHVAESWTNSGAALQVNVMGTHHLLDAVAAEAPACRVVVVSSGLVYRASDRALREDDPLGPSEPYGVSKLGQEMLALKATTPVVLARAFNHAGPRQQPAFATSSFARQIAEIEAGLAEPHLRVGNLDSRRDITDVRDTVRGYEALGARGVNGRAYNICSGQARRVGDLLELLLMRARVSIEVRQDPQRLRPSDVPVVLGDPGLAERDTGWRAAIPIEQTMDDLLEWWRGQVARRVS
ncbi:MAG TPA: GDP-mannose 4,6-dehydratase [Vicinamibacterales bacterium]|nr:GDP-mannose 4,6-dehydratase [Vicinamibacterales bacterium]